MSGTTAVGAGSEQATRISRISRASRAVDSSFAMLGLLSFSIIRPYILQQYRLASSHDA